MGLPNADQIERSRRAENIRDARRDLNSAQASFAFLLEDLRRLRSSLQRSEPVLARSCRIWIDQTIAELVAADDSLTLAASSLPSTL